MMLHRLLSKLFGTSSEQVEEVNINKLPIPEETKSKQSQNKMEKKRKRSQSTECDADSEDDPNEVDLEYSQAAGEIINVIPETKPSLQFMKPEELIKLVEQYSFQTSIPKRTTEDILVRPLVYSDRTAMEDAIRLGEVSARSLFFRFTRAIKRFTDSQLDYFTHIDYHSHFALGLVLIHSNYKGIATARYIVDTDDDTMAEWAVIVLDHYQGLGLGTLLFYSLCHAAYIHGIKSLKAVVHPDNHSVLGWMKRANATHEEHGNTCYWVVHLPIHDGFLYDPSLEEKIHNSFNNNTILDPAAKYHLLDELTSCYNILSTPSLHSLNSNSEGVVCGSYESITNIRSFSSSNPSLNKRLEELSASSDTSEIDDMEFVF